MDNHVELFEDEKSKLEEENKTFRSIITNMQKSLNKLDSDDWRKIINILGLPEKEFVPGDNDGSNPISEDHEKIYWLLHHMCCNHFDKDTIMNFDISRIGKEKDG